MQTKFSKVCHHFHSTGGGESSGTEWKFPFILYFFHFDGFPSWYLVLRFVDQEGLQKDAVSLLSHAQLLSELRRPGAEIFYSNILDKYFHAEIF